MSLKKITIEEEYLQEWVATLSYVDYPNPSSSLDGVQPVQYKDRLSCRVFVKSRYWPPYCNFGGFRSRVDGGGSQPLIRPLRTTER
jgi:hypothetical protein